MVVDWVVGCLGREHEGAEPAFMRYHHLHPLYYPLYIACVQSVVRGWFTTGGRYLHAGAALLLSVFSLRPSYRNSKRQGVSRSKAWERLWADPRGTFNALLEQEGLGGPDAVEHPPRSAQIDDPTGAQKRRKKWLDFWKRQHNGRREPDEFIDRHEVNLVRGSVLFVRQPSSLLTYSSRRGLVEDTRLWVEVAIAWAFETARRFIRTIFWLDKPQMDVDAPDSRLTFSTQSRSSYWRNKTRQGAARWNARRWEEYHVFTASDAILRAGYPLEEHSVTTPDGYVLQMHRIPRRGARDVVLFQHGVLDTSLGWVAGGAGGSAALAAHDAGFDVWLANTRSNPPRLNVNPSRRGSCYWHYSANELAMVDLTTQIEHIHAAKIAELAVPGVGITTQKGLNTAMHRCATEACIDPSHLPNGVGGEHTVSGARDNEARFDEGPAGTLSSALPLRRTQSDSFAASVPSETASRELDNGKHHFQSTTGEALPYRLQAVGHSLGAACLLMYAVGCRLEGRPHRLRRLILLSPAGFHPRIPLAVWPIRYLLPLIVALVDTLRPRGAGMGLRLPTPVLRWIAFKLIADLKRAPALLELFQVGLRVATSGDSSEWHAAFGLPHYATFSMPAVSLHTANHFAQWSFDGCFRFYDYGRKKNLAKYGLEKPPSVSENYKLLRDLPVDLAAGLSDGLIPPENVERHAEALRRANVTTYIRRFDYGHLEFTFGTRGEVVAFVLNRLKQSAWG